MKALLFIIGSIFLLPITLSSQDMNPEEVVQKQLDAYNSRDLAAFVAFYTEDIEIYNFRESDPFISGSAALEKVYSEVFKDSPELKATIDKRIVFDNKVIDHEKVTGRKGLAFIEVVAIYEVRDNLIHRVTFIRKER